MPAALLLALFALLFLAPTTPAGAGGLPTPYPLPADADARVSVVVTPAASSWNGEGFMPVRVRIENGASGRRAWTLHFAVNNEYNSQTRHSAPFVVEPRSVAETVVFVPGNRRPSDGHSAWVSVGAEGPGLSLGQMQIVHRGGHSSQVSTAVSAVQETALFAASNSAPGPRVEASVFDPALWPADWRSWSAFERVVLTESELARLDGARRAALREWVAMGGVLDLYLDRSSDRHAGPGLERVGLGAIRRAGRTLADEESIKPGYIPFHHGVNPGNSINVPTERRASLELSTGRLGLSLFLAGFGLLIGPINLFVFAPAHRRHRLFITVPAFALAASALMAGYIVVKDGFGGEGVRRGYVVLLPESNQAVVSQSQVARTGVLLGKAFEIDPDVVLSQGATTVNRSPVDQQNFGRAVERASDGWFASRRVQEQTLRRLVPTRARVELVGEEGGAPVVQSSLGAALRDFVYTDARGRRWAAESIEPGRRVALRASAAYESTAPFPAPPAGRFAALGGVAEGLTPIPTLGSIRWDEEVFFYTGPLTGSRMP